MLQDNICSYCGFPAKKSQEHPRNRVQIIYSCKSSECLNQFRAMIEDISSDTRAVFLRYKK